MQDAKMAQEALNRRSSDFVNFFSSILNISTYLLVTYQSKVALFFLTEVDTAN